MKQIWGYNYHKVLERAQRNFRDGKGFIFWGRDDKWYAKPVIIEPLEQIAGVKYYKFNQISRRFEVQGERL